MIPCHYGPHAPGVSCRYCQRGECLCTYWTTLDLPARHREIERGQHATGCSPAKREKRIVLQPDGITWLDEKGRAYVAKP